MTVERRRFALAWLVGLVYGMVYLYSIGDVSLAAPPLWDWRAAPLSLERALSARAPFVFEAVAIAEAGYLVLLLSPLNLLIAGLLAGLLAANIHGVLYRRAHPGLCRPSRGGLLAGAVPALLAGGACCAPSLVVLLGLPGLGAFSAFFGWLVPASLLLLGGNRLWQRRLGAPAMTGEPEPMPD